jgi:hypothetical protein
MIGIFHHVIAINTIGRILFPHNFRQLPPFFKTGTVSAITITNRQRPGKPKGKTNMSQGTKSSENESRLWVAVALSMTMIFTSYAISVLDHQKDQQFNAHTNSQRPIVVSYLA